MEKRTQGAWLINHTKKLNSYNNTQDFGDIELAGKCGVFLSNLAASEVQSDIDKNKVEAITRVSNIKKTEIDTIKNKLKEAQLIDVAKNGAISVIGVTTSAVLGHTADIFENDNPSDFQKAALTLSEDVSDLPKGEKRLTEFISDTYKLPLPDTQELFSQSEEFGFVDFEKLDDDSKFYFNGNLFRRDTVAKTDAVLKSLKSEEIRKISELDEYLSKNGCVVLVKAKTILGDTLLSKLTSIGMYDFNDVSNSKETMTIITKPSAFSKYGNPFEEDALDLAKAFVSALFYGMNHSTNGRGKIQMLELLMRKLIRGEWVGPATAIGEDYRLLELKRVIELSQKPNTNMFYMKLLKKDIGELALQVLQFGDATNQAIKNPDMYAGSVTTYVGPEQKRVIHRKHENQISKKAVSEMLRTFRS